MGFAQREELGVVVANCGSLVHINFETKGEIREYSGLNLNSPVMAAFHLAALHEGVYFAPRCFMNTSTAMDEQVIVDVLDACSQTIARVAGLLDFTRVGG